MVVAGSLHQLQIILLSGVSLGEHLLFHSLLFFCYVVTHVRNDVHQSTIYKKKLLLNTMMNIMNMLVLYSKVFLYFESNARTYTLYTKQEFVEKRI